MTRREGTVPRLLGGETVPLRASMPERIMQLNFLLMLNVWHILFVILLSLHVCSMYQHYALLASAFVYVVMVLPVIIVLFFIAWIVLIVIYCDLL